LKDPVARSLKMPLRKKEVYFSIREKRFKREKRKGKKKKKKKKKETYQPRTTANTVNVEVSLHKIIRVRCLVDTVETACKGKTKLTKIRRRQKKIRRIKYAYIYVAFL